MSEIDSDYIENFGKQLLGFWQPTNSMSWKNIPKEKTEEMYIYAIGLISSDGYKYFKDVFVYLDLDFAIETLFEHTDPSEYGIYKIYFSAILEDNLDIIETNPKRYFLKKTLRGTLQTVF
jgi:hypothetical protein